MTVTEHSFEYHDELGRVLDVIVTLDDAGELTRAEAFTEEGEPVTLEIDVQVAFVRLAMGC